MTLDSSYQPLPSDDAGQVIHSEQAVTAFSVYQGHPFEDGRPIPHGTDTLGRRNRALQAVPEVDWARFSEGLQRSVLMEGKVLHATGHPVDRVYFPNNGLISLIAEDAQGHGIEVMMTGSEGVIGALSALSGQPATLRAQVQVLGTALWMDADTFRDEFARGGEFATWMMRSFAYADTYIAQCALCNRLHPLEERLARWMLTLSDRLDNAEIRITHDVIGQTLGSRRSGVTTALGDFQRMGLLRVARGSIVLLDRAGLENAACSCYGVLRHSFDAL